VNSLVADTSHPAAVTAPLCGIVEGFYGQSWAWSERHQLPDFLQASGLNAYLYCPKADIYLRKHWRETWSDDTEAHLQTLGRRFASARVSWGVGLSPYALYDRYGPTERRALRARVEQLNQLGASLLAVLFDDMPGDRADLAPRQSEIVADVMDATAAARVLVCPTYYSTDPQLERYFGARPPAYWEDLGRLLPDEVDIFWTGPKVCSRSISAADLREIGAALRRPVTLWDNYPVNDGSRAWQHLYLGALPDREPALAAGVRGHFCNPMLQAQLSRLPLLGLALLYGNLQCSEEAWAERWYGPALAGLLLRDAACFAERGLAGMSAAEKSVLRSQYAALTHPAAREVVAWLDEVYRFDPACLTQ
jgi:hyaluronoglucosaminidase